MNKEDYLMGANSGARSSERSRHDTRREKHVHSVEIKPEMTEDKKQKILQILIDELSETKQLYESYQGGAVRTHGVPLETPEIFAAKVEETTRRFACKVLDTFPGEKWAEGLAANIIAIREQHEDYWDEEWIDAADRILGLAQQGQLTLKHGGVHDFSNLSLDQVVEQSMRDENLEVLRATVGQFENPYLYIRELTQNSLDAQATKINIETYHDDEGRACIAIEDDGTGMDINILKKYFLNLYASSKDKDRSTIGRFGVGLVSVFMQEPYKIVVETAKEGEKEKGCGPLKVVLDALESGAGGKIVRPKNPRVTKGTRLTLYTKLNKRELAEATQNLREELVASCSYTPTPLTFNGELINQEFDIEAPIKYRGGAKGLEFIMALSGTKLYKLMNHRLVIESGEEFTEGTDGVELLIDSRYLDYTISRNEAKKNKQLDYIKNHIDRAKIKLVREAFKYIAVSENGGDYANPDEEQSRVWNFALSYLDQKLKIKQDGKDIKRISRKDVKTALKSVDKEVLDSELFEDVEGNMLSIRELLEAARKQGTIYLSRNDHLAQEARATGLIVLKQYTFKTIQTNWGSERADTNDNYVMQLLGRLAPVAMLKDEFYAGKEISRAALDEERCELLDEINGELRKIKPLRKKIARVEFGHFSRSDMKGHNYSKRQQQARKPYYSVNNMHQGNKTWGSKRIKSQRRSLLERAVTTARKSDTILLDPDHEYAVNMMNARGAERTRAVYRFLSALAVEKTNKKNNISPAVYAAYAEKMAEQKIILEKIMILEKQALTTAEENASTTTSSTGAR